MKDKRKIYTQKRKERKIRKIKNMKNTKKSNKKNNKKKVEYAIDKYKNIIYLL